jgi:RecA/RadA recombinase
LISESVAVIPANAAKENNVYILKNHQLELQEIKVISQKQDSLFVEGLKDNDTLVIEYIVPSKEIKKYIGITQQ